MTLHFKDASLPTIFSHNQVPMTGWNEYLILKDKSRRIPGFGEYDSIHFVFDDLGSILFHEPTKKTTTVDRFICSRDRLITWGNPKGPSPHVYRAGIDKTSKLERGITEFTSVIDTSIGTMMTLRRKEKEFAMLIDLKGETKNYTNHFKDFNHNIYALSDTIGYSGIYPNDNKFISWDKKEFDLGFPARDTCEITRVYSTGCFIDIVELYTIDGKAILYGIDPLKGKNGTIWSFEGSFVAASSIMDSLALITVDETKRVIDIQTGKDLVDKANSIEAITKCAIPGTYTLWRS